MLMTNDRGVMRSAVNSRATNLLGWSATAVVFASSAALLVTWIV
jgi:Mn2+/Fe2+ NRAMP family transporter